MNNYKYMINTQGYYKKVLLDRIFRAIHEIRKKTGCDYEDLVIHAGVEAYSRLIDTNDLAVEFNPRAMSIEVYGIEVIKDRYIVDEEIIIMKKPITDYISALQFNNRIIYDSIRDYCEKDVTAVRDAWETQFNCKTVYQDDTADVIRYGLVNITLDKDKTEEELMLRKLKIKKVIYNAPATIVYWEDGDKTVVKAQNGEKFDKEKGLAMAMCKRMANDKGNYNDVFKKWCKE